MFVASQQMPTVARRNLLVDIWTTMLLVVPLYGCLYPLESYLSLGGGAGDVVNPGATLVLLPVPVTPIMLVLQMASALGFYVALLRRGTLRHDALAYIFLAVAFVSTLSSALPLYSLQRTLRLLPIVMLALAIPQYHGVRKTLYLMTIAFLIACVLSLFLAVAVPSLGMSRLGGGYENAWRGAFGHKNRAGIAFAIGVLICLAAYGGRAARPVLAFGTMLFCAFMMVRSQSGGAMIGLAAAAPVFLYLTVLRHVPERVRPLMLGLLVLLIAFTALILPIIADALFSLADRDPTFTGRAQIWQGAIGLIGERPLRGYGYGFWSIDSSIRDLVWRRIGIDTGHAHNSWLDLWLQLGILGPVTIAAIILVALWRQLRLVMANAAGEAPAFAALLMLLVIRGNIEPQFSDPMPNILFFPIMISMCGVLARGARRAPLRVAAPPVARAAQPANPRFAPAARPMRSLPSAKA